MEASFVMQVNDDFLALLIYLAFLNIY